MSMRRVSFLVLANLGLAACTKDPPPASPEPPAGSLDVPPMPALPASTAPVASTPPPLDTPPPAPTGKVPSTGGGGLDLDGGTCTTNKDCKGSEFCSKDSRKTTGRCKYPSRGRTLMVEGEARVAPFRETVGAPAPTRSSGGTPGDELAALREGAREEHASIAAFARTMCELMALGAPAALLAETQRALADEIRHTERTLDLLEKLTGSRPVLGNLEAATAPLARDVGAFFRDVLHGGAIGETLAAAEAETRRQATADPDLRAFYEMIVRDESRHAALAFKTLRWLIQTQPELTAILDEERPAIPATLRPLFDAALA